MRKRIFKSVYAGPDFFNKNNENGNGKKPYPDNYLENGGDDRAMVDVYAGPGMMGETDYDDEASMECVYDGPKVPEDEPENEGPIMNGVYACPQNPPKAPRMMLVYAGPEVMGGRVRPGTNDGKRPSVCPGCGMLVPPGLRFCKNCGAEVNRAEAAPLFCPECGKKVEPGDPFCPECGTVLNKKTEDAGDTAAFPKIQTPMPKVNTDGWARAADPDETKRICRNCGTSVAVSAKFCPECGQSFDSGARTECVYAAPGAMKRKGLRRLFTRSRV